MLLRTNFLFLIFILCTESLLFSQSKKSCDSLVGKDYSFLVSEADEIFLGQVYQASNRKRISDYMIMPVYSYKGKIRMPLEFSQLPNPKFFNFKEDSSFVFLVFKSYEDTIFSSCFLFGKKENMGSYLKLTDDFCNQIEKPSGGSCERIYSPVCGCDYIEYGNECEAGVENWVDGPCKLHLCKPKHGPIANCKCIMPYWPVCGCNGVTYGNECEANCNGIYNFTRGECK